MYPSKGADLYYYLNQDLNNWYDWYDAHPDYTLDSAMAAFRKEYPWQPGDSAKLIQDLPREANWKEFVDTTYWPARINTRFYPR
jgi:hypothetical protein